MVSGVISNSNENGRDEFNFSGLELGRESLENDSNEKDNVTVPNDA